MVDYKEKGCCFVHCRYNMRKNSMPVLIGVHPIKKNNKKTHLKTDDIQC